MDDFDLLPEAVDWRDEGCQLSPRCLDCPLPKCAEEEPRRKQRLAISIRDREIAELRQQGKDLKQIAGTFGISVRSVRRALSRTSNVRARNKVPEPSQSEEIASPW